MPFDGSDLSLLSNAEVLALALTRPGRDVLLTLEALMMARIAASAPAKRRAYTPKGTAETRKVRANRRAYTDAAKTAPAWRFDASSPFARMANPLGHIRQAALRAIHGEPVERDGYLVFGGAVAACAINGGVWDVLPDGNLRLWSREAREALHVTGEALAIAEIEAEQARAAEWAARQAAEAESSRQARRRSHAQATIKSALSTWRAMRANPDADVAPVFGRGRRRRITGATPRQVAQMHIRAAWRMRGMLRSGAIDGHTPLTHGYC